MSKGHAPHIQTVIRLDPHHPRLHAVGPSPANPHLGHGSHNKNFFRLLSLCFAQSHLAVLGQ